DKPFGLIDERAFLHSSYFHFFARKNV
ncbi:hypothetical protein D047_1429B, partial [Vibrio parahaemolyticus VPTS-2010_2]